MADSTNNLPQVVAGSGAAQRVNDLFAAASPATLYAQNPTTTTGLTWGYLGGRYKSTLIANATLTLTASATNYIVAAKATGAVSVSTTNTNWNNSTDFERLYLVVTGASAITSYEDHREGIGSSAAGGGGLTHWEDGVNTAVPNDTRPVVLLRAKNAAADVDAALMPKGLGAIVAQVADNLASGGAKRGLRAFDMQMFREDSLQVAQGAYSVLVSGRSNRVQGDYSCLVGGQFNRALTGQYISMLGGQDNNASGSHSVIVGGSTNTNSGANGFIGGGFGNNVSGQNAVVAGGEGNTANAKDSAIMGGRSAHVLGVIGAEAYSSGQFTVNGDAQRRRFILRITTTTATAATLATDAGAAATINQVVLFYNTSAYAVRGTVVARENATGAAKSFEFQALIKRGADAASVALVGSPTVTTLFADTGTTAWAVSITANTALGCLSIAVTGEAAKTIRWVADVQTVEVVG